MKLRDEGLAWRRLGEQIMVLDVQTSTYFSVGGAGSVLFEALHERSQDEAGLVATLLSTYDVDEATATRDVSDFVSRLRDADLLVP